MRVSKKLTSCCDLVLFNKKKILLFVCLQQLVVISKNSDSCYDLSCFVDSSVSQIDFGQLRYLFTKNKARNVKDKFFS